MYTNFLRNGFLFALVLAIKKQKGIFILVMTKREFLKASSLLSMGVVFSFPKLEELLSTVKHVSPQQLASDEEFWLEVKQGYRLADDFVNLENGYYCVLPEEVLEAYVKHIRDVNKLGAYYMRTFQIANKARMVKELALVAGCSPEEIIITRNTTESLNMIISGFPWNKGDEAVMAEQDYPAMLDMFEQVSQRYGMVNKKVSLPLHPSSDEEIVSIYEKAITPETKLLMVCQVINITGQILPVKKICNMAHARGVQVMVDGAHAFAHLKFKVDDLNCDYYGCSLHKWLSAPLGAGLLYVKKENVSKIWPLFAEMKVFHQGIGRLNHTGTIPVHTDLAIADAIAFHNKIGIERKEARLRYLQNYWVNQVRGLPNVLLNTPAQAGRSCGIANVGITKYKPAELAKVLFDTYRIFTVHIDWAGVHGCRVTPNVYTSTNDLDKLVKAIKELAA